MLLGNYLRGYHSRLLISKALLKQGFGSTHRLRNDDALLGCGSDEWHKGVGMYLRHILPETIGIGEHHHFRRYRLLLAQLACHGRSEVGNLLLQLLHLIYLGRETARNAYRLLCLKSVFKFQARDASQFFPCSDTTNAKHHPHNAFRQLRKLICCIDTPCFQFRSSATPDTPNIFYRKLAQHLFNVLRAMHVATASQFRILLAEFRGYLGKRLGRSDAHRNRDRSHLPTLCGDALRIRIKVYIFHPPEIQECLIDGIDLNAGSKLFQHPTNPLRHITIEGHISGEHCHIVPPDNISYLEKRCTHLYTQGLGFVAPGNGTAVIVRQNNDGFSLQIGTKYPLARSKKVVTIGQGKHRYIFLMT